MADPKKALMVALAASLLSACAPPPPVWQVDGERKVSHEQAVLAGYMGHQYFMRPGTQFSVCPQEDPLSNCIPVESNVTINGFDGRLYSKSWMHVTFDNGFSGFVQFDLSDIETMLLDHAPPPPPTVYPSFLDHASGKEAARRRQLPGVLVGMDEDDALASAWGKPDRRARMQSEDMDREEWFYPDGNALYFEFGRLVAIQN